MKRWSTHSMRNIEQVAQPVVGGRSYGNADDALTL